MGVLRSCIPGSRFKLRTFAHHMGLCKPDTKPAYDYSVVRDYRVGIGEVAENPSAFDFTWTVGGVKQVQRLHMIAYPMDQEDPNWGFDPEDIAVLKTRIMVSVYASA